MKYYITSLCIGILICMQPVFTIAQNERERTDKNFYLSFSPYYTPGYLGFIRDQYRTVVGPSPYIYSKDISRPVRINLREKYIK